MERICKRCKNYDAKEFGKFDRTQTFNLADQKLQEVTLFSTKGNLSEFFKSQVWMINHRWILPFDKWQSMGSTWDVVVLSKLPQILANEENLNEISERIFGKKPMLSREHCNVADDARTGTTPANRYHLVFEYGTFWNQIHQSGGATSIVCLCGVSNTDIMHNRKTTGFKKITFSRNVIEMSTNASRMVYAPLITRLSGKSFYPLK